MPKITMKESNTDVEAMLNLAAANSGSIDLSIPIMAPTKALTMINKMNC
jgi:hypothetical protein